MICTKKIWALIALCTIAMPIFIFSFFQIKQVYLQHIMEEKLEHQALQTITLQKNTFVWVKHHKEIKVYNRLFDVKSFLDNGDCITFIGLYDTDEDVIKKTIIALHHKECPKNKTYSLSILKLFFVPLLKTDFLFTNLTTIAISTKKYMHYSTELVSQVVQVSTPPPII